MQRLGESKVSRNFFSERINISTQKLENKSCLFLFIYFKFFCFYSGKAIYKVRSRTFHGLERTDVFRFGLNLLAAARRRGGDGGRRRIGQHAHLLL